jgi:hypothetical protein
MYVLKDSIGNFVCDVAINTFSNDFDLAQKFDDLKTAFIARQFLSISGFYIYSVDFCGVD